jgi:signal transduction histidine kinase
VNASDKRLKGRSSTRFLQQELQAPAIAVIETLDVLIEVAQRRSSDHLPDLKRMHAASIRLNAFVKQLVQEPPGRQQLESPEDFDRRLRHDLRTPLNAIKGYSELLLEDLDAGGNGDLARDLRTLKETADQMLDRIESTSGLAPQEQAAQRPKLGIVADVLRSLQPHEIGSAPKKHMPPSRILVVDDDAANRDVLMRRLAREGHQVVNATGGSSALELAATREFDLILLDLVMPEMSGFEVLRRLKAVENTYHVPVIVISAIDELDSVARCIEAGAEDYLQKPFNPILLRARIGACLEKKSLRDREKRFIADLEETLRRDIAKRRQVEAALHESETRRFLIEAERLAALGGLVAGVAHEISSPVGTSLTIASTLAHRSAIFAEHVASGQMRRSVLSEFTDHCHDATGQLVANLQRAGELIQSFKQVAVDRSHADRRTFDLKITTEQIVASLRPGLQKSQCALVVEIPADIMMDSFPGPYGQVLTNLVFNSVTHGFNGVDGGRVLISARRLDPRHVEIVVSDDGKGISDEVKRHIFDPFFTTRRAQGSTGLGLHIVYNIVTRHLGGRVDLESTPGRGAAFHMTLPILAPSEEERPVSIPPSN